MRLVKGPALFRKHRPKILAKNTVKGVIALDGRMAERLHLAGARSGKAETGFPEGSCQAKENIAT
jgi:hypothetical protein